MSAASLASAQPTPPSQAAMQEARVRYDRGTKLYEEGAFEAALVELQRAYDLAPTPSILYNIALVDLARNDYAAALHAFRKYLDDGGDKITAARRAEVEKRLGELVNRVAHVTLKSDLAGADVLLDDVAVGKTPLTEPLLINTGRHKLGLVSKDGVLVAVKSVTVAGGDELTLPLNVELQPPTKSTVDPTPTAPPPPVIVTAPPAPPKPPPPRASSNVWIGWLAAGTLGAGAVATGIAAFAASRDLDHLRAHPNPSLTDLQSASTKAKTLSIVTDIVGAAALGTAGVSLYFTLKTSPTAPATAGVNWQRAF